MPKINPRTVRSLLTLGIAGLLCSVARPAAACWDGYSATVGAVQILREIDSASWNPDDAREAARWGARINALVPPGAEVSVGQYRETTCTSTNGACGAFTSLPIGSEDLPAAFRVVAQAFGVKPDAVEKASLLDPTLYTVQIFAGSERGALQVKERVSELEVDVPSFFEEGGFPAKNGFVHVMRDKSRPHRVIVGVFLDRKAADDTLVGLRAKGIRGFVRELPAGEPVDEGIRIRLNDAPRAPRAGRAGK